MPMLDFKGKQFVYAHHLSVPFRTLELDLGENKMLFRMLLQDTWEADIRIGLV